MLYIFCEHLQDVESDSQHEFDVVLEDNLAFEAPQLLKMSRPDLRQHVEEGHEICLVLSAKTCSIHHVKIPKVKSKDLPNVLKSVVEDQLTQDFSELFMFYQIQQEHLDGCDYRVFLWDKNDIQFLLDYFKDFGPLKLTLDWFALKDQEALVDAQGNALVFVDEIQGWLNASLFKQRQSTELQKAVCIDLENLSREVWCVTRFSELGLVDILLRPKSFDIHMYLPRAKFDPIFYRSLLALVFFVGVAFVMFFAKGATFYMQNNQNIQSYAEKPSESLAQKLALYQRQQQQKNKFWELFIPFQKVYIPGLQIKQISFRQNKLYVSLTVQQLQMLHLVKSRLTAMHLKVEDTQVVSEQQGTRAVLIIEKY